VKRRSYILVFRNNQNEKLDVLEEFKEGVLEQGDVIFLLDHNVVFLKSVHNVETLTARLRERALTNAYFFLADITDTSRAGNMVPPFWDILHGTGARTPAAADA